MLQVCIPYDRCIANICNQLTLGHNSLQFIYHGLSTLTLLQDKFRNIFRYIKIRLMCQNRDVQQYIRDRTMQKWRIRRIPLALATSNTMPMTGVALSIIYEQLNVVVYIFVALIIQENSVTVPIYHRCFMKISLDMWTNKLNKQINIVWKKKPSVSLHLCCKSQYASLYYNLPLFFSLFIYIWHCVCVCMYSILFCSLYVCASFVKNDVSSSSVTHTVLL